MNETIVIIALIGTALGFLAVGWCQNTLHGHHSRRH